MNMSEYRNLKKSLKENKELDKQKKWKIGLKRKTENIKIIVL